MGGGIKAIWVTYFKGVCEQTHANLHLIEAEWRGVTHILK